MITYEHIPVVTVVLGPDQAPVLDATVTFGAEGLPGGMVHIKGKAPNGTEAELITYVSNVVIFPKHYGGTPGPIEVIQVIHNVLRSNGMCLRPRKGGGLSLRPAVEEEPPTPHIMWDGPNEPERVH